MFLLQIEHTDTSSVLCIAQAHHTLALVIGTSPWQQTLILGGLFILRCVIDSSKQVNAAELCVLLVKEHFHGTIILC